MSQIGALTDTHDSGREEPWSVNDAPASFVQTLLKSIVGLAIPVDHLEGNWRVSQNQPEQNKLGVVEGFRNDRNSALADLDMSGTSAR